MKKGYNEVWVDNIDNQEILTEWHDEKMLSDEQLAAAKLQFPVGFYQPNIFVEIGLFLFTNMVISACFGFASITVFAFLIDSSIGFAFVSLLFGGLLVFILDFFIKDRNFYRSGADNALMYVAIGSFITAIFSASEFNWPAYLYCLCILVILVPFLFRYGDPLVAIGFYGTWIAFWFTLMTEFPIGKLILPFVIMIVSGISYYLVIQWKKRSTSSYYTDCQINIETMCLLTFYLGGNYYVVREGNGLLNNLSESTQIAFAPLFYFFTVVIPIVYIFRGVQKQDRKMLMVGILAVAFSIYTYRQYFVTLPVEWAMTLGGAGLIGFSILAIRIFKVSKWGLTYQKSKASKYRDFEAFIVSQAIHQPNQADKFKFGGGNFGGSGAGSEY